MLLCLIKRVYLPPFIIAINRKVGLKKAPSCLNFTAPIIKNSYAISKSLCAANYLFTKTSRFGLLNNEQNAQACPIDQAQGRSPRMVIVVMRPGQ